MTNSQRLGSHEWENYTMGTACGMKGRSASLCTGLTGFAATTVDMVGATIRLGTT